MQPTATGYGILAALCLLAIVEQWTSDTPGLWRYAAAALVLALLYEWIRTRQASLRARHAGRVVLRLGRPHTLLLEFDNADAPSNLVYAPNLPPEMRSARDERSCRVPANSIIQQELPVIAQALGEFHWPSVATRIRGPLGLSWWRRDLAVEATLTVVPDLLGPTGTAAGDVRQGSRSVHTGQGQELHHLREYTPGDPRHTIDWKATARHGQPITRVYQEDQHVEVIVVLDIGRTSRTTINDLSQFAHYINLAARFAQLAVAEGDHVGLIVAAEKPLAMVPPQGGTRAVGQIRGVLKGLAARAVETDLLAAASAAQRISQQRSLVIVLTDLYGLSLDGNFGQAIRLLRQRHLPMVVGLLDPNVIALQGRTAAQPSEVLEGIAATEYIHALNTNAKGAGRLGAASLVSRPAELQSQVFARYHLLKHQHRL